MIGSFEGCCSDPVGVTILVFQKRTVVTVLVVTITAVTVAVMIVAHK